MSNAEIISDLANARGAFLRESLGIMVRNHGPEDIFPALANVLDDYVGHLRAPHRRLLRARATTGSWPSTSTATTSSSKTTIRRRSEAHGPTLSEQLEAQTLRLIAHLDEMDKRAAERTKGRARNARPDHRHARRRGDQEGRMSMNLDELLQSGVDHARTS